MAIRATEIASAGKKDASNLARIIHERHLLNSMNFHANDYSRFYEKKKLPDIAPEVLINSAAPQGPSEESALSSSFQH